ncbi:hypothetical protein M1512_00105 [Patescibacteria group bacterium]|jgi:hypothetical protein|nr:hypothetical protein [Patescibacteria group bacterium]
MEFSNRGGVPVTSNQSPVNRVPDFTGSSRHHTKQPKKLLESLLTKWASLILGAMIVILLVAVTLVVASTQPKSQANYVYSNKLQAVFLNTGQVYFGNIQSINPQYLVLTNIFYLQTNNQSSSSSSSNNNVSLVKLGCELHAPYDQMVINMQQVTFWENLRSSGQVAKAVAQYYKEYPHGQTCTNQSATTGSPTPSSVTTTPPTAKP